MGYTAEFWLKAEAGTLLGVPVRYGFAFLSLANALADRLVKELTNWAVALSALAAALEVVPFVELA